MASRAGARPPRVKGRTIVLLYALTDLVIIFGVGLLSYAIRYHGSPLALWAPSGSPDIRAQWWGFLVLFAGFTVATFSNYGLYRTVRGRTYIGEALAVLKGTTLSAAIVMISIFLLKAHGISRLVVLSTWLMSALALAGWRSARRAYVEGRLSRGAGLKNALIIGAEGAGRKLAEALAADKRLGYRIAGFVDDCETGPSVLGRIEDLPRVIQEHFVEELFIAAPLDEGTMKEVLLAARRFRLDVKLVLEPHAGPPPRTAVEPIGRLLTLDLYSPPIPELGLLCKRLLDVIVAAIGLVVCLPLMGLIALAIKLDSPGPVIYRSKRVGMKGRVFTCYKFRSMVKDADRLKEKLRALNERQGPFFKLTDDPRITRVGRFIRKYNLDELPQLWNVLKGEMSLVGPRPHPLDDFERYELEHYRRLDVKPGMTSLWAVEAQDDPSFERNMELDLYYIENWSLWLDIKILLRTIPTVLKGVGR